MTQSGRVTVGTLDLEGTGPYTLDTQLNTIRRLTGTVTGGNVSVSERGGNLVVSNLSDTGTNRTISVTTTGYMNASNVNGGTGGSVYLTATNGNLEATGITGDTNVGLYSGANLYATNVTAGNAINTRSLGTTQVNNTNSGTGNTTIWSNGNITQTGAILGNTLTATTSNTRADILLDSFANNFATVNLQTLNAGQTAATNSNINYRDSNGFDISRINTLATATLTSGGAVTQSGGVTGGIFTDNLVVHTRSDSGAAITLGHIANHSNTVDLATNSVAGTTTAIVNNVLQSSIADILYLDSGSTNVLKAQGLNIRLNAAETLTIVGELTGAPNMIEVEAGGNVYVDAATNRLVLKDNANIQTSLSPGSDAGAIELRPSADISFIGSGTPLISTIGSDATEPNRGRSIVFGANIVGVPVDEMTPNGTTLKILTAPTPSGSTATTSPLVAFTRSSIIGVKSVEINADRTDISRPASIVTGFDPFTPGPGPGSSQGNVTSGDPGEFSISATDHITVGDGEKWTAFGSLSLKASTITVTNINAVKNLKIEADHVVLNPKPPSETLLRDTSKSTGEKNLASVRSIGSSWVAGKTITYKNFTGTSLGSQPELHGALPNSFSVGAREINDSLSTLQGFGFVTRQVDVDVFNAASDVRKSLLFYTDSVPPNSTGPLVNSPGFTDPAGAGLENIAEALAGVTAVTSPDVEPSVAVVGNDLKALLRKLLLKLRTDESSSRGERSYQALSNLRGWSLVNDGTRSIREKSQVQPLISDFRISKQRLGGDIGLGVTGNGIFDQPFIRMILRIQMTEADAKKTLETEYAAPIEAAWTEYLAANSEGKSAGAEKFAAFLKAQESSGNGSKNVNAAISKLREVNQIFSAIDQLGLTSFEADPSKQVIAGQLTTTHGRLFLVDLVNAFSPSN